MVVIEGERKNRWNPPLNPRPWALSNRLLGRISAPKHAPAHTRAYAFRRESAHFRFHLPAHTHTPIHTQTCTLSLRTGWPSFWAQRRPSSTLTDSPPSHRPSPPTQRGVTSFSGVFRCLLLFVRVWGFFVCWVICACTRGCLSLRAPVSWVFACMRACASSR